MKNVAKILFQLIGYEICDNTIKAEDFVLFTNEDYLTLYKLSKQHDLAHLVGHALIENKLIYSNCPVYGNFEKEYMMAVYRYENINYTLEQLKFILNDAEIPFIPLKGSVIRKYYPEPWMRTSCDIDVLIHEEDLNKASEYLIDKLNYSYEGKGSHDVQFYSPNQVHLELHYTLIEENLVNDVTSVLNQVWDLCRQENQEYCCSMNDEMFYFYHIAHMAKHLQNGGCGVRPFIDLWILDHMIEHSDEKRNALLERGGLLKFADAARTLSEVWLSNHEGDKTTDLLQNYILYGGVYGNQINQADMQSAKQGSKFKYAMKRIFLPYETMRFQYPVLENHKWLLPICEVRRWCRLVFCGRLKSSVRELKTIKNISQEQMKNTADLLSKLGL